MSIHNLVKRFRCKPIKQKLILLMMAVATISVLLTTIASTISGAIYIKQNEANELKVLAELVGDKNAAALAFHDQGLVKANLDILASKPSVRVACIYDAAGTLFAEYKAARQGEPCLKNITLRNSKAVTSSHLTIHHPIYKKSSRLGTIYLQSDLRAADNYLHTQWVVSGGIIVGICLVSYLLTLLLQRFISNPIKVLAEECKAIFQDDYSVRARNIYHDELGDIVDSFNKILEERERKHKEFFATSEAVTHMSQTTQKTLAVLDNEALLPFKAAHTFKILLEQQAFGPVNTLYSQYFNDVYTAETQLYYVLARAFTNMKLQMELLSSTKETIILGELVEDCVREHFDKAADPRLSYTIYADNVTYTAYRKPLQRLMEHLAALFTSSKTLGRLYHCQFDVEEGQAGTVIRATMHDPRTATSNDNYQVLPLEYLINKIRNNEEFSENKEDYFINLRDIGFQTHLYTIQFLSNISQAMVEVMLAPHGIIVVVKLCVGEGARLENFAKPA